MKNKLFTLLSDPETSSIIKEAASAMLTTLSSVSIKLSEFIRNKFIFLVHDFDDSLFVDDVVVENKKEDDIDELDNDLLSISKQNNGSSSRGLSNQDSMTPPPSIPTKMQIEKANDELNAKKNPPGITAEHHRRRRTGSIVLSPIFSPSAVASGSSSGSFSESLSHTPNRKLFVEPDPPARLNQDRAYGNSDSIPDISLSSVTGTQKGARTPLRKPSVTQMMLHSNSRLPSKTPVTSALESTNWLRRELENALDAPSVFVRRFYKSMDQNPEDFISNLLLQMRYAVEEEYISTLSVTQRDLFSSSSTTTTTSSASVIVSTATITSGAAVIAAETTSSIEKKNPRLSSIDQPIISSIKLFYRVLENILRYEDERLHEQFILSDLLFNETFIRCLFACTLEIVLSIKNIFKLAYPRLLDIIHVQPCELLKLTGKICEFLPSIPHTIAAHFVSIEESILLENVWKSSSSVHLLLSGPSSRSAPSNNSSAEHSENNNDQSMNIQSNTATTNENDLPPPITTQVSTLQVSKTSFDTRNICFFSIPAKNLIRKKVVKVADERINRIGSSLHLTHEMMKNASQIAIKAIFTGNSLQVIGDRHLDQILISSLYGMCKVSGVNISFKILITAYQKSINLSLTQNQQSKILSQQNNTHHKVTHDILLDAPTSRGNIVDYYNKVFLPQMKQYIVEAKSTIPDGFALASDTVTQHENIASPARNPMSSSSRDPSNPGNVAMTPVTHSLFAHPTPLSRPPPNMSHLVDAASTSSTSQATTYPSFQKSLKFE